MSIGKVYVAGSLDNAIEVQKIQNKLRSSQIEITYDWTTHGRVYDRVALREIAKKEKNGVVDCDVFFATLPGGGGTHCELGMALILGKPIVIYEAKEVEEKSFYNLPNIDRFDTIDHAVQRVILLCVLIKQHRYTHINY